MVENEQGEYQIDFESLIRVLGENLYANPKAAIRELIQNANDSCVRRQAEDASCQPEIHVRVDEVMRTISIEDSGCGMVREDVVKYLAVIGRGRTRQERQRLSTTDRQVAQMLIGQFGIGFLSSFLLAERVVVNTRQFRGRALPVCWECEGTAEYSIGRGARPGPGTEVVLFMKQAHFDLLDEEALREVIRYYADFISFPIHLNDSAIPVNLMSAPWHRDAVTAEYEETIKRRYGVAPLALEPVYVDANELQIRGVLFILPAGYFQNNKMATAEVFQKRMFIGPNPDLMPAWARFVHAIVESPDLQLLASRDAMTKLSQELLQKQLEALVILFIKRLAREDRRTFIEIVRQYNWLILGGACHNDFFFQEVKDLIPLKTDIGELTVPKYLERIKPAASGMKYIYYVPEGQTPGQQHLAMFKARAIPVIHADYVSGQFIRKYADDADHVIAREVSSGIRDLMEPVYDSEWLPLVRHFEAIGVEAVAARFRPAELIAIVMRKADYETEQILLDLFGSLTKLDDVLQRVAGQHTAIAYVLAFNVDNALIRRLTDFAGAPSVLEAALKVIWAGAFLASGLELDFEQNQRFALDQMRIIELLLDLVDSSKPNDTD
jgi:molecular chaperone HtpG